MVGNGSLVLRVEGLKMYVYDPGARGFFRIVDGVSLDVPEGKTVALVGESGSGKTRLIYSIMGLIDAYPGVIAGHVYLSTESGVVDLLDGLEQVCQVREAGGELTVAKDERRWRRRCGYEERMRRVRGRRIGLMLQEAKSALSPYQSVYDQVREAYEIGHGTSEGAEEAVTSLLHELHISEKAREYPHNLSGGTCHRAMMALTFAADPDLLIADEPTTGLDCPLQVKVVEMLDRFRRGDLIRRKANKKRSLLLVSHQLEVVEKLADEVVVMYAGRIMESGPSELILHGGARHPYTRRIVDIYRNPPDLEAVQSPMLVHEGTGREHSLGSGQTVIGRGGSGTQLPDVAVSDPLVSRKHAVIAADERGFHIVNHGRNGTMVDGRRIDEPTHLKPGNIIQVGGTEFRYVLRSGGERPLVSISGAVPSPLAQTRGCRFFDRCEERMEICESEPPGESALDPYGACRVFCHIHGLQQQGGQETVVARVGSPSKRT